MTHLKEAQVLLLASPIYLRSEANDIIKTAYHDCYNQIFAEETANAPVTFRGLSSDQQADRDVLGISWDEDLQVTADRYTARTAQSLKRIRQEGVL